MFNIDIKLTNNGLITQHQHVFKLYTLKEAKEYVKQLEKESRKISWKSPNYIIKLIYNNDSLPDNTIGVLLKHTDTQYCDSIIFYTLTTDDTHYLSVEK